MNLSVLDTNGNFLSFFQLGALCPLEPRLAKKLSEPITNIISTTPAKSLLYECISTATTGMTQNKALMELCTEKLRGFVMEADPNLKYLGLVGLCNVIVVYPRMISGHKDIILACLDDEDVTIRMRVLELLSGMASRKNLPDIVKKIRQHIDMSDGAYRDKLVSQLMNTCSQDNYSFVADFQWYISTLIDLSHLRGLGLVHGKFIADQMIDVVVRVDTVRPFAVSKMLLLLRDAHILSESTTDSSTQEVLFAAAWIVGEFSTLITDYSEALNALTQSRVTFLPSHVQGAYVQSAFKVLVSGIQSAIDTAEDETEKMAQVEVLKDLFAEKLKMFTESIHVEVQERACFSSVMLTNLVGQDGINAELNEALMSVFGVELNPVGLKAQRKVKAPEGIDLEAWIGEELLPEPEPTEETHSNVFFLDGDQAAEVNFMPKQSKKELRRIAREQKKLEKLRKKDPFYIAMQAAAAEPEPTVEEIPITELDLSHMDEPKKKKKKKKKGDDDDDDFEDVTPSVHVKSVLDEPEGDESPAANKKKGDVLDIDINAPLRMDEVLPEMKGYGRQTADMFAPVDSPKKDKKKKSKKEEKKEKKGKKSKEEELIEAAKKGKSEKKKKDKKTKGDDVVDFVEAAPEPVVEAPKKKEKKEKKDKKEKKSKSDSTSSGDVPTGKATLLCKNELISVNITFESVPNNAKQVCIPFVFKNVGSAQVSDVSFQTKDSMNTKLVNFSGSATDSFSLPPGATMVRKLHFGCDSFARTQKLQGNATFSGPAGPGSIDFQLVIPCSAFVTPAPNTSKEDFTAAVTGQDCQHLSSVKIPVPPPKMKWAIEAIAEILHVTMIECVSGAASFYGTTTSGQPVAVLVKAKSSGLTLEVRSFDEHFVASLTAEAFAAIGAEL